MSESVYVLHLDGRREVFGSRADAERRLSEFNGRLVAGPVSVIEYIPAGWRSMETAPKDGRAVFLRRQKIDEFSPPYHYIAAWKDCGDYGFWIDSDDCGVPTLVDGWFPIPE